MFILEEQRKYEPLPGHSQATPTFDLTYGAQNGYMPKLGGIDNGKNFAEWVSATPHARSPIIAIPLFTPGYLDLIAEPTEARKLKKMWADIFTIYPKSISGLDSRLTLNTGEIQLGPSESLFLEVGLKVVRARSQITNSYDERLGKSIGEFLDYNLVNTEGHEHTQSPLITTDPEMRKKMKGRIWGPHLKTGVILYVELDVINVNVQDAWLAGNINNKAGGLHVGSRDISSGRELETFDVDLTSLVESGDYIKAYAQHVVDRLLIFTRNPETDIPIFINKDEANATVSNPLGVGFNDTAGMSGQIEIG